ncbi:hypothetical protein [Pseudomonas siliginis]|uniref:hypothetical protein n=1 Tax=Pseudomonas siliginis TaxID=2842346 RepID=UPI003D65BAB7
MDERYTVKSAIHTETGSVRNGVINSSVAPRGFQIYDTIENKRHPDCYMSRSEAQQECDRRNGR